MIIDGVKYLEGAELEAYVRKIHKRNEEIKGHKTENNNNNIIDNDNKDITDKKDIKETKNELIEKGLELQLGSKRKLTRMSYDNLYKMIYGSE